MKGLATGDGSAEARDGHKEAIESGIRAGLAKIGDASAAATIFFIESRYGLKLEEVQARPDEFVRALRGIFGQGADVLIRSILDQLRALSPESVEQKEHLESFQKSLESLTALAQHPPYLWRERPGLRTRAASAAEYPGVKRSVTLWGSHGPPSAELQVS